MKEFFGIKEPFRFEWNDLRAFIQIINVALIMVLSMLLSSWCLAYLWLGLVLLLHSLES